MVLVTHVSECVDFLHALTVASAIPLGFLMCFAVPANVREGRLGPETSTEHTINQLPVGSSATRAPCPDLHEDKVEVHSESKTMENNDIRRMDKVLAWGD